MRFYKLRVTPNAAAIASTFNEQFQPEIITSDPNEIHWLDFDVKDSVLTGEEVSCVHSKVATGSADLDLGSSNRQSSILWLHCALAYSRVLLQYQGLSFYPDDPQRPRGPP